MFKYRSTALSRGLERAWSKPPVGVGYPSHLYCVRKKCSGDIWLYKSSRIPSKSRCFFFDWLHLLLIIHAQTREDTYQRSAHRNQDSSAAAAIMTLLHSCWKPAVAHHGSESSKTPLATLAEWLLPLLCARIPLTHLRKVCVNGYIMVRKMPMVWPHHLHFMYSVAKVFFSLICSTFSKVCLSLSTVAYVQFSEWEDNKKGNIQRAFLQGIITTSAK